jgi:hypothetical protein
LAGADNGIDLAESIAFMEPTTAAVIAIAVAAISEALSLYPKIKANGIIQLVLMVARTLFPKR